MLYFSCRFGSSSLKCRTCGIYVHHDCKHLYTKACVRNGHGKLFGRQGYIGDYVGSESPMIPSLIIHCIKEVSYDSFLDLMKSFITQHSIFRLNHEVFQKRVFIVCLVPIKR